MYMSENDARPDPDYPALPVNVSSAAAAAAAAAALPTTYDPLSGSTLQPNATLSGMPAQVPRTRKLQFIIGRDNRTRVRPTTSMPWWVRVPSLRQPVSDTVAFVMQRHMTAAGYMLGLDMLTKRLLRYTAATATITGVPSADWSIQTSLANVPIAQPP
jgi:hypothetical protein